MPENPQNSVPDNQPDPAEPDPVGENPRPGDGWFAEIEEETGAPPEPSGYSRWQSLRHRAIRERDALICAGVDPRDANERAWEIAYAAREADLRARALARLRRVRELTEQAQRVADEAAAQIGAGAGTEPVLTALDEAIVLHWRIADILSIDWRAFDGSARDRESGGD